MKKKLKKDKNEKVVIALISGSVGELDWNLPILDFLIKENFILKIIFLKCAAYESLKKNILVSQFINKNKNNIKIFRNGGYFIEKIDHFIYIIYRILVKLKLDKLSLIKFLYDVAYADKILEVGEERLIRRIADLIKIKDIEVLKIKDTSKNKN